MDYFPKNTVANYVTHLPKQMRLQGEWETALVESHYPCSLPTVAYDACIWVEYESIISKTLSTISELPSKAVIPKTVFPLPSEMVMLKLTTGYYKDIHELIKMINSSYNVIQYMYLEYDKELDRVKITTTMRGIVDIHFSHDLSIQLGFDPYEKKLVNNLAAIWPPNIPMGLPKQMYVYCDLIEPQMIGDTTAPLLKIVNIDRANYVHGSETTVHYTSPHYVPVMKGTFETIEIDLRKDTGSRVPFIFGTSYVKLHFRKVQQQQQQQQ